MAIKFDMFGSFMIHMICSNMKGCLTIKSRVAWECSTWKSFNRGSNHISSHTTATMALYSASAEDLETVCCLFDFQEIKESPRNIQ